MSTTAEMRSVRVGGQLLRVAVRPGLGGPGSGAGGQPPRAPLLLVNGIGASLELLAPFVAELDLALEVIRFDPLRRRRVSPVAPALPFQRAVATSDRRALLDQARP